MLKKIYLLGILCLTNLSLIATIKDVEILKEDIKKYHLQELKENNHLPFKKYEQAEFKEINASYWLRFKYEKTTSQSSYFLFSHFLLYKKLDLYFTVNDSNYHFKNGVSIDFEGRNLYSTNLYLELPNSLSPTICYLHVIGFYGYSFFFIEKENKAIIHNELKQGNIEFLIIGLGLLTIIFSFIFFLYLKDKLYFYYAIFSLMLIMSRLTQNGYIVDYTHWLYPINSLKAIYNFYSISYAGINIALLLYFHEYLKFYQRSKRYSITIYGLAIIRFIFLIIHINTGNNFLTKFIDNHLLDLGIQFFLLAVAIKSAKYHFKPILIAIVSLAILFLGNLLYVLPDWKIISLEPYINYMFFLNFAGIEVIVFAIGIAYRSFYLKKEHDKAVALVIENMKEREHLKDNINKELELKVAERTAQIQRMNDLLKLHNIELKSEVKDAQEARAFQKNMSFADFKKIFPNDKDCFQYLFDLKRKQNPVFKCKKCSYEKHSILENFSLRCGKCNYIESVTTGTLFNKLKFSILKAFYITYLTSTTVKETATLAEISKEIELRTGTLWLFKQKVLELIDANKTKKKHKDGWTHLIQYSIK